MTGVGRLRGWFGHGDGLDRRSLLSRSLTHLGLAVAIAGLYAAIVVGAPVAVGRTLEGGPGLLLPIAATAVVALAFEPLRSGLQRVANRLVYGERATPLEVLSRATAQLGESSEQETDHLARLVADGSGASQATVWVLVGEVLHAHGSWPPQAETEVEPLPLIDVTRRPHRAIELIRHGDDVLGALSITKRAGEAVSVADRNLVADVAAGAGLVLRNIGLNAELEERARQVRSSRRRLVAARDEERHRLERDLHDGAQQHVVALKVKLDVARAMASRDDHRRLAERLGRLSTDAQAAVEALRAIAHGIYPPLLEAEGLGPALGSLTGPEGLDLEITTENLGWLPRRIEETLYFCGRELIDGVSAAGGTLLDLAVTTDAGQRVLRAESDVAPPEAVTIAIADRVDAAGGALRTDAAGSGKRVEIVFGADRDALI